MENFGLKMEAGQNVPPFHHPLHAATALLPLDGGSIIFPPRNPLGTTLHDELGLLQWDKKVK